MPNLNRIIYQALKLDCDLVPFEINRLLHDLFPDQHILVTDEYVFDLNAFIQDGRCAAWALTDMDPLLVATWKGRDKGTWLEPRQAFSEILWNGHLLNCLTVTHRYDCLSFLIAKSREVAEGFFQAVCLWQTDADGRVTVFDGRFRRDPALEEAIQTSRWQDLVLPIAQKDCLHSDVTKFFQHKDQYARFGMSWKRGILLHGPPGNGKTKAVRALLRDAGKPVLVVRSLREDEDSPMPPASQVFRRARRTAPAIVLFEDIDTLVSRTNLSSLLNELDGLAQNEGILTIATTNHLDRLDGALSNRPSRFDRVYEFGNPKLAERQRLLELKFSLLDEAMRPSNAAIESAAKSVKGFSGALLQDLVNSCAISWMNHQVLGLMDAVLGREVERAIGPKASRRRKTNP